MNHKNIFYKDIISCPDDFYSLYKTTGWNIDEPKSCEYLYNSISNSWYMVSAYYGDKLIGFGRVVSDGYLHAYIHEVIIGSSFQGLGIGKRIIDKLLDKIHCANIKDIQLFCAKGKKEFYLKNGFVERPNDAPEMQYQI